MADIKNVVFDMGGVLIEYDARKSMLKYFSPEDAETVLATLFETNYWSEWDRGAATAEQTAERVNSALPERMHAEMRRIILNWGDEMPYKPDTYELVKDLKRAGARLYLLSNVPQYFYEFRKTVPALEYFDGFVISSDYLMVKPDPGLYRVLFDKYSLDPRECVFIDDMRKNIETAEALGMTGCCFEDGDCERLRAALRGLGFDLNRA